MFIIYLIDKVCFDNDSVHPSSFMFVACSVSLMNVWQLIIMVILTILERGIDFPYFSNVTKNAINILNSFLKA